MAAGPDDLGAGERRPQRHSERAPRLQLGRQRGADVGERRVAPHIVGRELRARDAEPGERHRERLWLVVPVDGDDRPPARRALGHPQARRPVASHAPQPAAAAAVVDAHGEHVLAAPVERVHRDGVAAIGEPFGAVVGRELPGLAELHPVEERLIDVVHLSQLEENRRSLTPGTGHLEPGAVPPEAVVVGVSGALPPLRHGDRLPRFLIVGPGGVRRVVAGPEPPRPGDTEHLITGHDRRRQLALDLGCARGAARDGGHGQRASQQRQACRGQLGEVVGEHVDGARDRHDRRPGPRLGLGERRPHDETVGVVEPRAAVVEAPQRGRARRGLEAAPACVHVGPDAHAVHVADGVLQRGATAQQERLGAEPVADRREARPVGLGVGESAEVLGARGGPQQEVDLHVVVAPIAHDAARQLAQPRLHLGMRPVERVDLAAPVVAGVPHDRAGGVLEQPLGVRGRDAGAVGHRERRDPQAGLKRPRVDAIGEPAVPVRELGIRVPVPGGFLIAVVELDQAEGAAVEVRGAELEVGDHVVLGHLAEQLVPRAPSGRDRHRREALAVHR